jgi:hydrogenase/urease accessory protein HupE
VQKILLLLIPLFLFAHQSGLSYIKITKKGSQLFDVVYKKPLSDLYANKITINYPSYCIKTEEDPQTILNGFIINHYYLTCQKKGLIGSRIWIDGLLRQDKGVLVEYAQKDFKQQRVLRSNKPYIHIKKESSTGELFLDYVKLGIHHILSGYDHLLFVFSLLLLAKSRKSLLFAITAFTLAHSITLASAMLGLVNLPVAFIESMIALSIIFLARELVEEKSKTVTKTHLEYIAFIFGLLHGFGFSNVLKSIGLADNALLLSLFSFNLGIEIGQLFFITLAALFFYSLKKLTHFDIYNNRRYAGYLIGITASFWFIQRVLSF